VKLHEERLTFAEWELAAGLFPLARTLGQSQRQNQDQPSPAAQQWADFSAKNCGETRGH